MDRIVIIDTETSGLPQSDVFPPPQVLQVAAIAATWPRLDVLGEISVPVRFDPARFRWDPEAEAVHGLPAGDRGLPLADAFVRFYDWVHAVAGRTNVVAAGYCVSFDLWMLRVTAAPYYEAILERSGYLPINGTWNHRSIDAQSIGLGTFGLESSAQVCEWLGVERGAHDALEDCRWTLQLLRAARRVTPWPRLNRFLGRAFA